MTRRLEWLSVVGCAWLSALLLFIPSLSELGGTEQSLFMQLYEAFFHTAEPEMILGDGVDPTGSIWIVGFVEEVLFQGRPTMVKELYSPYGLDLGVHEGFAWLDTLFAIPLRWMIGTPGFYNWHVFNTLMFSFIGCYVLFKHVSKSVWPSLFLSHLLVVNEYVYQEISYGRPTQVNWLFGALFVYAAIRMAEERDTWHWPLLTGLFFGAYCLTYWFGAVGLGFVVFCWLVKSFLGEKSIRSLLRNFAVSVGALVLLVFPICWRAIEPILQGRGSKSYSAFLADPAKTLEILGLSLPIYSTEVLLSWEDFLIFVNGRHYPLTLWIASACLMVLSIRYRKGWVLFAWVVTILLPVGSALTINNTVYPTTYAFLEWVFPPLVRCNFPDRLMLSPLLVTNVLLLVVWSSNVRMSVDRWKNWMVGAVFVALIGNIAYVWSSHTPKVQAFQINRALVKTAKQNPGGFVEFPFDLGNNTYVQSEFHRQPILTGPGMMMVQPPASKRYRLQNKVLQDLNTINTSGFNPSIKMDELSLLQLEKDGFKHLILYTDEIQQPVSQFERYLRTKGTAHPKYGVHIIPIPTVGE